MNTQQDMASVNKGLDQLEKALEKNLGGYQAPAPETMWGVAGPAQRQRVDKGYELADLKANVLCHALPELRNYRPTSVNRLQAITMMMAGQSTDVVNISQAMLYRELVAEEYKELCDASNIKDYVDGILDTIVVLRGLLMSLGLDVETMEYEVAISNFSKMNLRTNVFELRDDGKYLKGPDYFKPDISTALTNVFINQYGGEEAPLAIQEINKQLIDHNEVVENRAG